MGFSLFVFDKTNNPLFHLVIKFLVTKKKEKKKKRKSLGASPPPCPDLLESSYRKEGGLDRVHGRQPHLGVDVEEPLQPAGGPDGRLDAKGVRLEVVVVVGALEREGRGDLRVVVLMVSIDLGSFVSRA